MTAKATIDPASSNHGPIRAGALTPDTLLERDLARRAGLGWFGKNTNLLTHDRAGSWVFLGELLLDLELEYDAARVADHCGTCTLCIDSGPTGAIVEPYVVDSNLCISHATIELRAPAEIPNAVAAHADGWITTPTFNQRVAPFFVMPKTAVAINRPTPTA